MSKKQKSKQKPVDKEKTANKIKQRSATNKIKQDIKVARDVIELDKVRNFGGHIKPPSSF